MEKAVLILILLNVLNYGCNQTNKFYAKSDKEVVVNFFEETYNKKNYQYVMDFFTNNYFEHRADGARTNQDCVNIIRGAEKVFLDL